MTGRGVWGTVVGLLFFVTQALRADAPEAAPAPRPAEPETLPQPGRVITEFPPGPGSFPGYHRTSRYDVWQYYAVDRFGGWKPRVIYSPYGDYYLYNHEPFPWAITRQREWQPWLYGTEYPAWPAPAYALPPRGWYGR